MSKRQQPHLDEKAIHGSSMYDEETLTPLGRLQLVPKQHNIHVQRKVASIYSSNKFLT